MAENSPLDINEKELHTLQLDDTDQLSLEGEEIGRFVLRVLTLSIVLVGSLVLVISVFRSKRGSCTEVIGFLLIQIIWQMLAFYSKHIDYLWVNALDCSTVHCEYRRKIYVFFENLFHGGAVYSGVALVGRLEGLVGVLLWILLSMSVVAPLLFAVVILLLDLSLTYEVRAEYPTLIGIALAKTIWFNIIPAGLLACWFLGQLLNGFTRIKTSSTRETASRMIGLVLILFHMVHLSEIIIYVIAKHLSLEKQIAMSSVTSWLLEVGYLLAALAIPSAWLLSILLPRRDSTTDVTEVNLKLAKQNKSKNVIQYRKPKKNVATPPTSPVKFTPEVTSSPSVFSEESSVTHLSDNMNKKSKRSSYIEAVSSGSLNFEPIPKSKSVDPLWLPSTKQLEV